MYLADSCNNAHQNPTVGFAIGPEFSRDKIVNTNVRGVGK